ncbi:MAG: putative signal transducing protein, partial [Dehalococcoidales bacterium]
MKYCPKCRGEFQDWVEKCVDCKVELVDALPIITDAENIDPGLESPTDPLVTIAIYNTAVDANLVKEIMESEGIPEVVVNEIEHTSNWIASQAIGGVHLLVRESDVGEAVEIVKSITDIVPAAYADIYGADDEAEVEDCGGLK